MIEKKEVCIPFYDGMRNLHIYLPLSYETTKKRYPVLYMFDGHNLFYDEDATFGKSWGLKSFLDNHKADIIVVGIECNHEGNMRLEEFSPYDFKDTSVGYIHGQGKAFMEWICEELKPYIDSKYRTLPQRQSTGIGGSSMGGLMSLYAILKHNDTFSKAACLSPFLFRIIQDFQEDTQSLPLAAETDVYISWGSDEFRSKNQLAWTSSRNIKIVNNLLQRGIRVYPNLIVKGKHSEASWELELPTIFEFLYHI